MSSSNKNIRLATPEPSARHQHYLALAELTGIEWLGTLDFSANRDYREVVDGVVGA